MRTINLLLLLLWVSLSVSCVSDDYEHAFDGNASIATAKKNAVEKQMLESTDQIVWAPSENGYGGTYLRCKYLSPYKNVLDISWTLGKYCHFSSLDIEVETPVNNRWSLVAGDPLNNSYIYTIYYPGMYSIYLRFYEEGEPSYPVRTNREIWVGHFLIDEITSTEPIDPGDKCRHDYSKIRFNTYEIIGNNVVFNGIVCDANYNLVLTSPYIRNFESIETLYAGPAAQSVLFYLPQNTLYKLGVYSTDCSKESQKCTDYKVIQFSNSVPHSGPEPVPF